MNKFTETFENFITQFDNINLPIGNLYMLFYAILKTEGDILLILGQIDRSIKCFRTLKEQCGLWGPKFDKLRMKSYEQIAICYHTQKMYKISCCYYKKALILAMVLGDNIAELRYYERLSTLAMNLGDTNKM